MATWSKMRERLEQEYLAEPLRGHIQYFATSYSKCPDHEGRATIRYDGKEILRGNYFNQWNLIDRFPRDKTYERRIGKEHAYMDETALKLGLFDQRCFYRSFTAFDSQSIEESLRADDLLVRIFAVMDRRVGKRRLQTLAENAAEQPPSVRVFLALRLHAEDMIAVFNDSGNPYFV